MGNVTSLMAMLEIALQITVCAVVIGIVAVIVQAAFAPRFVFMVQVRDGQLAVTKGKVSGESLDEMREVLVEFGVRSGWIGGVRRGKAVALKFSSTIPPACQQRLRNLWFAS